MGKKISIIPQLLTDNKVTSDFEAKANHFKKCFASQITPLNNNNNIPENQTYTINTKLSLIRFENKDIMNIIISLNVYKAHGHDNISFRISLLNLFQSYSTTVYIKVCSLISGKNRTSALLIKEVINKLLIITGQDHCYQFVEKYFQE